jgi:Pectate lyase superfamily protein
MKYLSVLLFCLCCSDAGAGVFPNGRTINWAPGLEYRNGIPNRTGLINVKLAPYNAAGDGVTDDTLAIQAAINAAQANQVVYLPASTYLISGTLNISTANTSLRGDGPASTIIHLSDNVGVRGINISYHSWSPRVAITSSCTKGATQITLATATAVQVGDIVVISQVNPSFVDTQGDSGQPITWAGAPGADGRGNDFTRVMTQVDLVTAINGDTLTLERPIYLTFDAAQSPAINYMTPTYGIGVENLQLYRTGTGVGGYNIAMGYVAESWVQNVASKNAQGSECDYHVELNDCYACQVQKCWFQGGGVNNAGQDYGVYLANNVSDALVEDNIFVGMRHSMVISAGGSGSVFGYNYSQANIEWDNGVPGTNWCAEDACTHGCEPYMTLFEGNIVDQITFDDTHGGNAYNTVFRCQSLAWSSATPNATENREGIDLAAGSYNANLVACVLGYSAHPDTADITYEGAAQSTAFVQGNYSIKTGAATWISGPVTLPASLYHGGNPPYWWGSMAWPAIGPDCSPVNGTIPAKERHQAGTL